MKFYVPFTIGHTQAEQVYELGKKRLEAIGFQVSDSRVQQLAFWYKNEMVYQRVGDTASNGEIIAAILHSNVGYFVCTFTETDEPAQSISLRFMQLIQKPSIVAIDYFDPR